MMVFSLFLGFICLLPVSQEPDVSLVPDFFEVGKIAEIQQNFSSQLKNDSRFPLVIKELKSSCFCFSIGNYPVTVNAGSTYEIKFTFDAKGKSGQFNGKLLVVCEHLGEIKNLVLRFSAFVVDKRRAIASPKGLFLSSNLNDRNLKQSLAIESFGDKPVMFEDLFFNGPNWIEVLPSGVAKIDLSDKLSGDGDKAAAQHPVDEGVKLLIKVKVPNLTGSMIDELVVKSKSNRFEPITVPVLVKSIGSVLVEPKSVVLVNSALDRIELILKCAAEPAGVIKIVGFELERLPEKSLRVVIDDGIEPTVYVDLKAVQDQVTLNGAILIKATLDGSDAQIRVPIYCKNDRR